MAIEIPGRVAERLVGEQVIWLTTTKADGTPLPNPVWFLWHGGQFLVFTEADSVKMKNMARSPRVSLNLNSDSEGGDVAIFQAQAEVNGAPASEPEFAAYLSKYEVGMRRMGITPEALTTGYRLIRLAPIKFRTVG